MNRTFVIGDIHGAARALQQCLERSGFDRQHDHLICLGDVCDGWPETNEAISELLTVNNLTYLLGNHDVWALDWMRNGKAEDIWLNQGGWATVRSYPDEVPYTHIELLQKAHYYYIHENKLFVHAGIDPSKPIEQQDAQTFLWDRHLVRTVLDFSEKGIDARLTTFDDIYVGHTPIPSGQPIHSCGVWLMDTGAGWSGVLSMMDVDNNKIFMSDPTPLLYPGVQGRASLRNQ